MRFWCLKGTSPQPFTCGELCLVALVYQLRVPLQSCVIAGEAARQALAPLAELASASTSASTPPSADPSAASPLAAAATQPGMATKYLEAWRAGSVPAEVMVLRLATPAAVQVRPFVVLDLPHLYCYLCRLFERLHLCHNHCRCYGPLRTFPRTGNRPTVHHRVQRWPQPVAWVLCQMRRTPCAC
jgi:hypothetical protein